MWFRRKRDQDLDDEIAAHLKMAAADLGEEGARRQFGNVGLVKEVTRQMWGFTFTEILLQDLRYALRVLIKNPGYTFLAVLLLALGIGASTAIFSLIDSIMLRALPVQNPGALVAIGDPSRPGSVHGGDVGDGTLFSFPFYQRFRQQNGVFKDVYATGPSETLNIGDSAEHPYARFVSNNYFSVLGVTPLLGRTFARDDRSTVVISYAFWKRQFASSPDVFGRELKLNASSFTIIGVTPPEFFGDIVGFPCDIWLPIVSQPLANPGRNYLNEIRTQWLLLMGRLKPGVTLTQAKAATNTIGVAILKEQFPRASGLKLTSLSDMKIAVQPAGNGFSRIRQTFSKPLLLLMALMALVLLICCTNVANLQLARAAGRTGEISLRLAIGASRSRLVRQLMTESTLIAFIGGLTGLLIAFPVGHALLSLEAVNDRLPVDFHLNVTSLLFVIVLSLTASLLFGLAPALSATRASVSSNLKDATRGLSSNPAHRFEKYLVVLQIVLSSVLLFGADLFVRTLQNLERIDVGYLRDQLVIAQIDPVGSGYQGERLIQLGNELLRNLTDTPLMKRACISENGLFSGTESATSVLVKGVAVQPAADQIVNSDRVGPGYFETIGSSILAGRGIEEQDMGVAARVAVLNESMARFYFHNRNPIGQSISTDDGKSWMPIIGVVRDAKQSNLREPARKRFYSQYAVSKDDPIGSMNLEIRVSAAAAQAKELIRQKILKVNPHLQIESIAPAKSLIDQELVQESAVAKLAGVFSLLALLLTSIGLYGVMSYLIRRRTAEIGIRMALGADRSDVLGMVLRDALQLALAGLMVGIVAGGALGILLAGNLYGVKPFEPIAIITATGCIVTAALVASWLPARRASRIEPLLALRTE
jgi:predicted permease